MTHTRLQLVLLLVAGSFFMPVLSKRIKIPSAVLLKRSWL